MRKILIGFAMLSATTAAAAQDMMLSEYLTRTEALLQRSHNQATPEYMRLKREVDTSLVNARRERRIARSQGRAPRACLSPSRPATTNAELARHFAAIPAEERGRITVGEAFMRLMERKFPCGGSAAG